MSNIDSIFNATLAKIEEEKAEAIRQKEIQRKEGQRIDENLRQRIQKALNKLSETTLSLLAPETDFSRFMFEKITYDPYAPRVARIIIANFPALDKVIDPQERRHFRIYILFESEGFKFKISCGYWWFCCGKLRSDLEIPASPELLDFIKTLNNPSTFIETCTRANVR